MTQGAEQMLTRRSALGQVTAVFAGTAAVAASAQKAPPTKAVNPATAVTVPAVPDVPPLPSLSPERAAILLPAGKHVVAANMTIRADVSLDPGAMIEEAAAKR